MCRYFNTINFDDLNQTQGGKRTGERDSFYYTYYKFSAQHIDIVKYIENNWILFFSCFFF